MTLVTNSRAENSLLRCWDDAMGYRESRGKEGGGGGERERGDGIAVDGCRSGDDLGVDGIVFCSFTNNCSSSLSSRSVPTKGTMTVGARDSIFLLRFLSWAVRLKASCRCHPSQPFLFFCSISSFHSLSFSHHSTHSLLPFLQDVSVYSSHDYTHEEQTTAISAYKYSTQRPPPTNFIPSSHSSHSERGTMAFLNKLKAVVQAEGARGIRQVLQKEGTKRFAQDLSANLSVDTLDFCEARHTQSPLGG